MVLILAGVCSATGAAAQTSVYSAPLASQIMQQSQQGIPNCSQGLLLKGMRAAWYNSANGALFTYEKNTLDKCMTLASTQAATGPQDSWNAGLLGGEFLRMYEITRQPAYYNAATSLDSQLTKDCTESSTSPCMAEPFLAAYATAFQHDADLGAIADQFLRWQKDVQPSRKDSAAKQPAAISHARFLAALADALPNFQHDKVDEQRLLKAFRSEADKWHPDNDTPLSAKLLHMYAVLKAVRFGYLPVEASNHAEGEWKKLIAQPLRPDAEDGALVLAATEMDLAKSAALGRGQTVLVDAWFNSQQRTNAAGQREYFHYKWNDYSDSGDSLLGHIFRGDGVNTDALYSAPTQANLAQAQYYVIVSPDNPAKNPTPHYMTAQDADEVAAWVGKGGVLVMLENDPPNADIAHLNLLADKFGIHFDDVLHHHIVNDKVRGDHIEDGTIHLPGGGPVFHDPHTIYLKDTCAITLSGSAQSLLNDRGDVVMATVRYGKGMVFAMVDPWAYNEYTDGRKNHAIYGQFDNFAAATELVRWLVEQHNALASAEN